MGWMRAKWQVLIFNSHKFTTLPAGGRGLWERKAWVLPSWTVISLPISRSNRRFHGHYDLGPPKRPTHGSHAGGWVYDLAAGGELAGRVRPGEISYPFFVYFQTFDRKRPKFFPSRVYCAGKAKVQLLGWGQHLKETPQQTFAM